MVKFGNSKGMLRALVAFVLNKLRLRRLTRHKFRITDKTQRKKIVIVSTAVLIPLFFVGGYLLQKNMLPNSSEVVAEQHTVLPPVAIRIPSLGVDADVESVAKDTEGRMDVPKKVMNTAWYNLGPKPGEVGNAVIAGHLDTPDNKPAIFSKLDTMKKGDEIEVIDALGAIYTFRVVKVETYPTEKFPIVAVFGTHKTARLNLITCAGAFDQAADTYAERTVVFSEFVDAQKSGEALSPKSSIGREG